MKTETCIHVGSVKIAKSFLAAITLLAILKSDALRAAGEDWTSLGPEGAQIESIVVNPKNPAEVYAGMNGKGFARLSGDSKQLVVSNDGLMSSIVLSLAPDPHQADTVYAGTGGGGVYKSADGGRRWAPANKGLEMKTVQSLAVDPHQAGTVFAGTWGDGIYKTTNGGEEWKSVGTQLAGAFVYALVADSAKRGVLLAGTSTGAWQSTDGAQTWSKLGPGIPEGVVEVIAINPGNSLEITLAVNTWVPGKQYVGAVLRSADGGKSWKSMASGLPETRITALAIDPANPRSIFAGTEKGVFHSQDGGSVWAAFGGQLKSPEIRAIALTSKPSARLLAGTERNGVMETAVAR